MPTRSYWPCKLIAHEAYHSIVFRDFDLLVHHFGGRDAGGYGVEGLAKKLARAKDPKLLKRAKFDSEASLFCAFGEDLDALHELATLLAEATGTTEAAVTTTASRAQQALGETDDHVARTCLIQGFSLSEDAALQRRFFELVPKPPAGAEQTRRQEELHDANPKVRLLAAQRLGRAAASTRWSWDSFCSDPRFTETLGSALDREKEDDVLCALLVLAHHTCVQHLPDLRLRPSFERLLRHSNASVRQGAVWCATSLFSWSWEALFPLFDDASPLVRAAVVGGSQFGEESFCTEVSDDYAYYERNDGVPGPTYERIVGALRDKNAAVRASAASAVCAIAFDGADEILRGAAAREKVSNVRAELARGIDLVSYNHPVRPLRRTMGIFELTRFRRLAVKGLDGPDVERILRASEPELATRVELSSRRGYFAAWGPDEEALVAVAVAIRELT